MTVRRWGSEQVVNTNTNGSQVESAVAALPGGGFVVVWTDNDVAGGDGSAGSIKMQRFDINGTKVGVETLVNTTTLGTQEDPTVVVRDNGDIWVAWTDQSGAGGNGNDIRFRRFESDGDAIDANDRIATALANDQSDAHLAILSSGEVVLSFTSADASNNVFAQRYNQTNGNTSGALINVANGGDNELASSIATLDDGFAVAWLDETVDVIFMRAFDDTGVPTIAATDVSDLIDEGTSDPQVQALGNGGFIVAWTEGNDVPFDDIGTSIRGQLFNGAGDEVGFEFQLNTDPFGTQDLLALTATADGGFIATYQSFAEVKGQLFDAFGVRIGAEFIVNSATFSGQTSPSVDMLADGRLAITWTDASGTGGDASANAIHVQVFDPRDGLITGTLAADTLLGHDFLNDEINGLAGADILDGRAGADNMYGGEGDDTYFVDNSADRANELFGAGTDMVLSFASFGLGANVENLTLIGSGAIAGTGNALGNAIAGNAKANVLKGLAGDDALLGSAGSDTLAGGGGKDTMNGGGGADRYDFDTIAESAVGATRDLISSFSKAQHDRIDVTTIDANTLLAGNQNFVFRGTQAFNGAGQIRYVKLDAAGTANDKTIVSGNVDGNLAQDFQIELKGLINLAAADFVL